MRFDELFESDDMLDALWDMHFDVCTPIQEQAIPIILQGRDLLACAQTGTGKTAAYLLPVIEMIADSDLPTDSVNCVIMAPTRELAQQIDQQLQGFSYYVPVSGLAVYGGTDGYTYEQQRKSLKSGADIVIATPGRLLAHLNMGYVDLSKVSYFILDEADRMLDMGFFDDIMSIVSHLPKNRQTLLFSATMPPKIQQMADKILNRPAQIKLSVSKPAEKIKQGAYICFENQKIPILKKILKDNPPQKAIIFASSKLKVKELAKEFKNSSKIKIGEMHSDLEQNRREEILLSFKAGHINVLFATDIVARGIDVDDIDLVINFDVPHEGEDYIHRVGRTARADKEGRAITFINEKERTKFRNIEKLLEKEVEKLPVDASLGKVPDYKTNESFERGKNRNRKRRNLKRDRNSPNNKNKKVESLENRKDQESVNRENKHQKKRYHPNKKKEN